MDYKQLRRAKKLIRKLCCNYDHGNCLALDDGEADLKDIQQNQERIWTAAEKIVSSLAALK